MSLITPFFLGQVLFLIALAVILSSSTLLSSYEEGMNVAEARQRIESTTPKYKYYANKKGTQVIEIGPRNACQIFQGEDAEWLRATKGEAVKAVGYIKFRLMVGKCQLDAFLNNRAPYVESQKKVEAINNQTFSSLPNSSTKQHSSIKSSDSFAPSKNETKTSSNNDLSPTEPTRLPLIFPGTKWCGAGSTARHHDDLGIYVETDKCCREHDLCKDNMEGKECKHGLCNDSEFTRSHCECDDIFRTCLQRDKTLSSLASFKIANLYFNILKPLCFAERPPVKWCKRHRITGECVDFEFDPDYRSEWQFFPAQPYLTEAVEKLISPALPSLPSLPFFRPPPPPPVLPIPIPTPNQEEDEEDEEEADHGRAIS